MRPAGSPLPPESLATLAAQGLFRVWVHICDICGTRMSEQHCKIRCSNCGYTRDCSDP